MKGLQYVTPILANHRYSQTIPSAEINWNAAPYALALQFTTPQGNSSYETSGVSGCGKWIVIGRAMKVKISKQIFAYQGLVLIFRSFKVWLC